jgi:hypothetical protein
MIRPLLLIATLTGPALFAASSARGEPQGLNSLSSFSAVDVSPVELQVSVGYSYDGARGSDDIFMTASAIQANGASVPGLVNDLTRAVVSVGTRRAITVLRRESAGQPIVSRRIEVCLNHRFSGDIVCRTFSHVRSWGTPGTPPQPPPPPEDPGTCTGSGEISGPLRWTVNGNRGGHKVSITSELREMVMSLPDGTELTTRLEQRRYVFSNVRAGRTYRIEPGRFRSDPPFRSVDCRRNVRFHNVDFRITGGPRGN